MGSSAIVTGAMNDTRGRLAMSTKQIKLDAAQRRIAECVHGSLLVIAPVGTGKTLVLAERIANAIASGIPPDRILGLTFTNRACNEMRERVRSRHPEFAESVRIQTFHGLCATMLRTEARYIGLPCDFVIYDDSDCIEVMKELDKGSACSVFEQFGTHYERERCWKGAVEAIQRVKTHALIELVSDVWSLVLIPEDVPWLCRAGLGVQDILAGRHA